MFSIIVARVSCWPVHLVFHRERDVSPTPQAAQISKGKRGLLNANQDSVRHGLTGDGETSEVSEVVSVLGYFTLFN